MVKIIPIILGIIVLIITVYTVTFGKSLFQTKTKAASDLVTVTFTSAGGVILNNKDRKVMGIDLAIEYDPNTMDVENVTDGKLFETVLVKRVDKNKIYFSAINKEARVVNGILLSIKMNGEASFKIIAPSDVIEGESLKNVLIY